MPVNEVADKINWSTANDYVVRAPHNYTNAHYSAQRSRTKSFWSPVRCSRVKTKYAYVQASHREHNNNNNNRVQKTHEPNLLLIRDHSMSDSPSTRRYTREAVKAEIAILRPQRWTELAETRKHFMTDRCVIKCLYVQQFNRFVCASVACALHLSANISRCNSDWAIACQVPKLCLHAVTGNGDRGSKTITQCRMHENIWSIRNDWNSGDFYVFDFFFSAWTENGTPFIRGSNFSGDRHRCWDAESWDMNRKKQNEIMLLPRCSACPSVRVKRN